MPCSGANNQETILHKPYLLAQLPSGYYQQLKEASQNRRPSSSNFTFPNPYGKPIPMDSVYKTPRSSSPPKRTINNPIPPGYFPPYPGSFGTAPIYQFYSNIQESPGSAYLPYAYPQDQPSFDPDKSVSQIDNRINALEKSLEKYGLLLGPGSESYFTRALQQIREVLTAETGYNKPDQAALTQLNEDLNNLETELRQRLHIPLEEYKQSLHLAEQELQVAEQELQELEIKQGQSKELPPDLGSRLASLRKEYTLLLTENFKLSQTRLNSFRQELAALHKQVETLPASQESPAIREATIKDEVKTEPPKPETDNKDPLDTKNFSRAARPAQAKTRNLSLEQEIDAARELLLQKHTAGQLGSFDLDILSQRLFDLANRARLSKSSTTHKLSARQENRLKAELHVLLNDMENRGEEK